MGTWVQLTTIGALVASDSGSVLATAMVAAATFAPQGIASPLGGVLADRFDRRRLFLVTMGLRTLATVVFAVVLFAGVRDPAALSAMLLVQSALGALGGPANQSMLPDLVPKEDLTAAVSLGILGWNAGRVLGPLIAALLTPFGAGWAITATAVTFGALWVAMASLRRPFLPAARVRASMPRELADGARALVRTRSVAAAVLTLAVLSFTYIPFMGLVPSTAASLLDRTGQATSEAAVTSAASKLMSAQGIGAVLGALAVASLVLRFRRSSVIHGGLLGIAVLLPLHSLVPSLPVSALAIAMLGAASSITFASFSGVVQRDTPPEERGRVLSWHQGAMGLCYGVALSVWGAAADRWGLEPVFLAGAVATLAVVAFTRFRSRRWAALIDGDAPPSTPARAQGSPAAATTA